MENYYSVTVCGIIQLDVWSTPEESAILEETIKALNKVNNEIGFLQDSISNMTIFTSGLDTSDIKYEVIESDDY
jgi:hypothetical protein